MLADITDYMYPWQLLPIFALAVGIVLLGGWLLHMGVKRLPDVKRPRMGKSILTILLALVAAVFALGVIFFFQKKLGEAITQNLRTPGMIVAGVIALLLAFFVVYTALGRSLGTTIKLLILPAVASLILIAVVTVPVGYFSNAQTQAKRSLGDCKENLAYVGRGIYRGSAINMPKNLKVLADDDLVKPEKLKCPGNTTREIGYFYLPFRSKDAKAEARRIIVCDFKDNHKGERNVVLLGTLTPEVFSDTQFQELLSEQVNADFKKALEAAEAGK